MLSWVWAGGVCPEFLSHFPGRDLNSPLESSLQEPLALGTGVATLGAVSGVCK